MLTQLSSNSWCNFDYINIYKQTSCWATQWGSSKHGLSETMCTYSNKRDHIKAHKSLCFLHCVHSLRNIWKSPTAAELTFILTPLSSVTCLLTQWASLCEKGKLFGWDLLGGVLWLSGGDGGGLSAPWDSLIRRSTSSESWTGMWELTDVHISTCTHTYIHTYKPLGVHAGQLCVLGKQQIKKTYPSSLMKSTHLPTSSRCAAVTCRCAWPSWIVRVPICLPGSAHEHILDLHSCCTICRFTWWKKNSKVCVNETETIFCFYKCLVTFAVTKSLNSLLPNVSLLVMLTPLNVVDTANLANTHVTLWTFRQHVHGALRYGCVVKWPLYWHFTTSYTS